MGGVQHAGHMWKKDGVSSVWRKLWFEVKGTRLTYFQRDDTSSLFNRSVAKRGQIRLDEIQEVRRSQASDAEDTEIEVSDASVRDRLRLSQPRSRCRAGSCPAGRCRSRAVCRLPSAC